MSEPLTERKALEVTRELWTWLANHPTRYKAEWPGFRSHGAMKNACPCCEFSSQESGVGMLANCYICPLRNQWPDVSMYACEDPGSAYERWQAHNSIGNPRQSEEEAWRMVEYCDKALAELDKNP